MACVRQFFSERAFTVEVKVISHKSSIAEQTKPSALFAPRKNLMPVVANLRVSNTLFIVFPESLNSTSTLMFVPHVVPESTLDACSHIVPVPITHSFKGEKLKRGQCNYH